MRIVGSSIYHYEKWMILPCRRGEGMREEGRGQGRIEEEGSYGILVINTKGMKEGRGA